ncbi:MAG: SDR family oxidoreductase [Firmicutes bacterium]|nr:SDR family oxidoreductase [Bacillota bacterium]
MMRYLVTGGAGFIGSHIVEALVARGDEVVVLDDFSSGQRENLAGVLDRIELIEGSICDPAAVQRACRGVEVVLHQAARTSVPQSVQDPIGTHVVNVEGTLNVLLAARQAKVRRVVVASSAAVYGQSPALPKTESMRPEPVSPYGVTKFVTELYAQVFGYAYGLENVSLRYFNVFGPRQDARSPYSGVLSKFCTALRTGETPKIYGDGTQSRDFVYVDNVVQANLLASQAPGVSGMVFNIGTGARISLNELLDCLTRISGASVSPAYLPPRAGDIQHSQADISRARQYLGYRPQVSFEEGLRRTWAWYRQHSSAD